MTESGILISTESNPLLPVSRMHRSHPFVFVIPHHFRPEIQPTGPNLGHLLVFYELIAHFLIFVIMFKIGKYIMCSVHTISPVRLWASDRVKCLKTNVAHPVKVSGGRWAHKIQ